jgi:4-aminobutyrate aminotransferase-like enzyme
MGRQASIDVAALVAAASACSVRHRCCSTRDRSISSAAGVWLFDADGTRYLDAYNNVASVGHCHPRVVAAVSWQMATLNTHTRYLSEIVYTCGTAAGDASARSVEYRVHCTGSSVI